MDFLSLCFLVPLLPFLGAVINGAISFGALNVPRRLIHTIACGSIFISFLISAGIFFELSLIEPEGARVFVFKCFEWISLPVIQADVAFLIDPLSAIMMLVVTGVGFLIHVYSIGYMKHDPGYARFFSYFNLFCFAMLILVMADNLLLMFVGWEGVGLCSYLLIGFWFDHKPNAVAGMKAFVVNRVGDFGFLVGVMFLLWAMWSVGHPSVQFVSLKENLPLIAGLKTGPFLLVTVVAVALFFGACGKSAQIPLYIWLPDAMAGPTPVSALIHAATMVAAGIYMIGRMNFLFHASPAALAIVASVGALTAIFAATIGFAQNDIKKVLAYSTVSQLGYMFLGMGTGAYAAGIFHLVTHAFFKACLFLGAGSVIIGMHHEQDIQKMGGLRKFMPITYWTFLAATLALAGIFPLAGFFSKDEILWQAFSLGDHSPLFYILWGLGLAGALCTAFYMIRLVSLVFLGSPAGGHDWVLHEEDMLDEEHVEDDLHQPKVPYESPPVITSVLVALALLSVVGGFIGVPFAIGRFIGVPNFIEEWLAPVFGSHHEALGGEVHQVHSTEYSLMILSISVALAGIALALWLYTRRKDVVESVAERLGWVYRLVRDKYRIDELYDWLIVKRLLELNNLLRSFDEKVVDACVDLSAAAGILWSRISGWFDWTFVDGSVNAVAGAAIISGKKLRKIQTGKIQHYFYIVVVGLLALIAWRIL